MQMDCQDYLCPCKTQELQVNFPVSLISLNCNLYLSHVSKCKLPQEKTLSWRKSPTVSKVAGLVRFLKMSNPSKCGNTKLELNTDVWCGEFESLSHKVFKQKSWNLSTKITLTCPGWKQLLEPTSDGVSLTKILRISLSHGYNVNSRSQILQWHLSIPEYGLLHHGRGFT